MRVSQSPAAVLTQSVLARPNPPYTSQPARTNKKVNGAFDEMPMIVEACRIGEKRVVYRNVLMVV